MARKTPRLRKLKEPVLLFTDERCVINGRPQPNLPLLVGVYGEIVEPVTNWLRHLAVFSSHPASTLLQYASVLRLFWAHLADRRRHWAESTTTS